MTETQGNKPEHVRWRQIGESVTSEYMNTQRKEVLIDPCECITKFFNAAETALNRATGNDAFSGKRERAMHTLRDVHHFRANVEAYEYGKTAEAAYGNTPPAKWRLATERELREYGFKGSKDLTLKNKKGVSSSFKAQLYLPINLRFCKPMPAVLAFKGTTMTELEDWLNNLQQGMDVNSKYYEKAVFLGMRRIKSARKPIVIVGHSLGGGLASACSRASGKDAWTFNAAGLHPNTVDKYGATLNQSQIEAFRHEGEVLTAVQEPGWLGRFAQVVVPTVTGLWLGGPLGAVVGGWVAKRFVDIPCAPGAKHSIACINEKWSGIERHSMDKTLMSFNQMLRDVETELREQTGVQCHQPVIA